MFRTINQKFYSIAGLLVLLFCIGYAEVAYFLNKQSQAAILGQDLVHIERDIRTLRELFLELRFWEHAVFSPDIQDAERNIGKLLEQIKTLLAGLNMSSLGTTITGRFGQIFTLLAQYEKEFNQLIQTDTQHRLQTTRIDSTYQSLTSSIFNLNQAILLKPLLVLTNFQTSYIKNHRQSEYQALLVVIDSLKRKLSREGYQDNRLEGYLDGYRISIDEDFEYSRRFEAIHLRFNETSARLKQLLSDISKEAESRLKIEFSRADANREGLRQSFLISSALGVMALLLILAMVARKIIRPVRSVAGVILDIKAGKASSRFDFAGNQKDEIVQLGLIFNDMLDAHENNNLKLIEYQTELEAKVNELAAREAEREALIDELEAKNAELERFTYTVSHDLKSPLITIRGFLGFVERDAISGNQKQLKEDMSRIAAATEKMLRLLNELLELSRIGRLINPPEQISFNEIVCEAVDMVSGRIGTQSIQIEIADPLPMISGDRQRLREVLENLLDNAAKYMGCQSAPRIKIGSRQAGEDIVYYVQDNGMGIEPQYRQKIFGLFNQLDPSAKGTGVGLAIVKRIIEVHGGRIWVESEGTGRGSTFCFTLPDKLGPDLKEPRDDEERTFGYSAG